MLINNVVKVERTVITTYPNWSDYGCLVNGINVITYEDGEFKFNQYITEDRIKEVESYKIKINYIDNLDKYLKKYENYLLEKRIEDSKKRGDSCRAIKGDKIEVYKGRKYPIGTQFIVDHSYIYRDVYGRPREFYWVDNQGNKVSQFNTIIIK